MCSGAAPGLSTGRVRTAGFRERRLWESLRRPERIVGRAGKRTVGARLPSADSIQGRRLRTRIPAGRTTLASASPTSSRCSRPRARGLGTCLLSSGPVRPATTGGVGSLRLAWTSGCATNTPTRPSLFGPPRASATPCRPQSARSFLSSASSAGGSGSSRSRPACPSASPVWLGALQSQKLSLLTFRCFCLDIKLGC